MTHQTIRFALIALFALTGCIEGLGGMPAPETDAPAWRLGGLSETTIAERAARRAACVPREGEVGAMQNPEGLAVGDIRLVEEDGATFLELELLNLSPEPFMAYPLLEVEILDGDLALPARVHRPGEDGRTIVSNYYGMFGCDLYVTRLPLVPAAAAAPEPVTLRVAASALGFEAPVDEWVFVLSPR